MSPDSTGGMRPAPSTTAAIVVSLWATLIPLREVVSGWDWALRVGGGIVAAAAVASLLESWRRLSLPALAAVIAGSGAVWATTVVGPAIRDDPVSLEPLRELGDGLFGGWSALLDEQVPLRDEPSALIFVAFLAWIAASAAVFSAARLRSALPAMGVCAGMLWGTIAASVPRDSAPLVAGALAGMGALLAVATLTRGEPERWHRGRAASLLAVVTVAGTFATLAGEVAARTGRDPVDPRSGRATSVVDLEVPDLLSEYGTRAVGDRLLLTIEPEGSDSVVENLRLRLQVYDAYDGERWHPAADFRDVARFPEPALLPPGKVVRAEVTLLDLDGPWLPLPDRLISVDLNDIDWNEVAQTALVDRSVGSYRFTGTVVARTGLEGLDSASDGVAAHLLEVPASLPSSIRRVAVEASSAATDAIGTVDAVTAVTRLLGRDDDRPSGHTLARLGRDLSERTATGPEQLVSLHALMLRSLGHPARVVVGFIAEETEVRADDLHVWTEVAFPGVGWIAFDPVPPASDAQADAVGPTPTSTPTPEEEVVRARALPRELGPGDDLEEAPSGGDRTITWVHALVALAAVAALAVIGLAGTRGWRRRNRRTAGDPDERALGAWAELVDRLREAGAPVTAVTTVGDVVYMATHLDPRLGTVAADIAAIASEALHGPAPPTAARAQRAWEALAEAEALTVELRGRRALIARSFDPRVLRYRAPTPPESRAGRRVRR